MKYYILAFKKAFDFNGKSSNKEFWYFFCINILIAIVIGFLSRPLNFPKETGSIFRLLILIPSLAVGFRRLNDAGFNKWLFLLPVVNLVLAGFPKKK